MANWKRLLYYLMINVLVSACTTVAVLMIWDRTQAPSALPPVEPVSTAVSAVISPTLAITTTQITGPAAAATPSATTLTINIENVQEYQVENGDTLGLIAEQFDVSVDELMAINQITNPNELAVGMVLYVPLAPEDIPTKTPAPTATLMPVTNLTPSGPTPEPRLIINAVIGPGDLASEHVFITYSGNTKLSLAGWQLKDEDGNVFLFPQLELVANGGINIWTTTGTTTVVDLYWGLGSAVWNPGETVTLIDAEGKQRATYKIP